MKCKNAHGADRQTDRHSAVHSAYSYLGGSITAVMTINSSKRRRFCWHYGPNSSTRNR